MHGQSFKPKLFKPKVSPLSDHEVRMRVAVIGGGPAGLYFAILLKRDRPDAHVTVVERNRPDDTFGFGVVFSDQTLDAFAAADAPSYRAIVENFAYWDDIEIHVRGTVHRIGGNGFCGCSRRSLLMLLHRRARALGVELAFNRDATPEDSPDADHNRKGDLGF